MRCKDSALMVLLGLFVFSGVLYAHVTPLRPLKVSFESTLSPVSPGPVVLRMIVTPLVECDKIQVEITEIDNLVYNGPLVLEALASKDQDVGFEFSLIIPANDTSGLDFKVSGGGMVVLDNAYWVSIGAEVEFHRGNPRRYPSALYPPKPQRGIRVIDSSEIAAAKNPHGKQTRGYLDKDGTFIAADSMPRKEKINKFVSNFVPGDTTVVWYRNDSGGLYPVKLSELPTKRERDLEEMRDLEKTPLTDYDRQDVLVDGEVWYRDRGEHKFRKAQSTTDPIGTASRELDSIRALHLNQTYDVILDLRDESDYEFVHSLEAKLQPTDSVGLYRATIIRSDLKLIEDRRIKYSIYPRYPSQPTARSRRKH